MMLEAIHSWETPWADASVAFWAVLSAVFAFQIIEWDLAS